MRPGGLFVTATDTDVGKTILSGALVGAIAAAGLAVRAHKPIVTGLDEISVARLADHELLGAVAGMAPEEVSPLRYGPAVSPHLAAALAGAGATPGQLIANALGVPAGSTADGGRDAEPGRIREGEILIVEGVGGLMVPLADGFTVRDLAVALDLGLVIAARPGLGTINHTLLTLAAARAVGLSVRAVVLTPWPHRPSTMQRSNRETIAAMGEVEVQTLRPVGDHRPEGLARAGQTLPWRRWLMLDGDQIAA